MSFDLAIFDAAGLTDFSKDNSDLISAVNQYIDNYQEKAITAPSSQPFATEAVKEFITEVERVYGKLDNNDSPWAMWPPMICANGRYCMFNLALSADRTNIMIYFCKLAKKFKLILIDPQGKNQLLTSPGGGGLLD